MPPPAFDDAWGGSSTGKGRDERAALSKKKALLPLSYADTPPMYGKKKVRNTNRGIMMHADPPEWFQIHSPNT